MLNWSSRFNIFCFLDNAGYSFQEPSFDCMLAAGSRFFITASPDNLFKEIKEFYDLHADWIFGHISYPVPAGFHQTEQPRIPFDPAFFFVPEYLLILKGNELIIETYPEIKSQDVFNEVMEEPSFIKSERLTELDIRSDLSRAEYIKHILSLKKHIQRGDCYEINYCMEFFAEGMIADPLCLYNRLQELSPNPFSAYYRINDRYCLCASPERFLKKSGSKVISQPIKGTSRRDIKDPAADMIEIDNLRNSPKERSENVMVVDLVRNDLSKVCTEGSVQVTELFGIYSFPQVHQMISTIEGKVDEQTHWTAIVNACFPMGSMTGAPKKKVTELIATYELRDRGLFSGSIGYVSPTGDFDFNVVIRSLFIDRERELITFLAGSGITAYCQPESEYDECLVKVEAIRKVLSGD